MTMSRPPAPTRSVPPDPESPAPLADDAGLGELAGQYDLLAEVGRGGSAVVYRARDRRLQREVALKAVRLAPALSQRERALEVARLAREARTTARLAHPNIVTVYAVHELRDGLAVAMQYVPGRSLKQVLAEEGALDPARAVRLLTEVAAALAYAHGSGVVHRDVKPENIFVDAASGRALLADFGAARAGDADVRVTRTGATVGTPAYMSPEQIDGGPVDGRADLYSLGLVAWEALTGRRPWEGAGLYQLLHYQKYDVLPPVAAVRPAGRPPVPLTLEYVVARLLEKRPGARWASADVVGAQLEHPILPADYKLWVREYRRRLAEFAAGEGHGGDVRRAPVSAGAPTEQFRPDDAANAADGTTPTLAVATGHEGTAAAAPAEVDDSPSWARSQESVRRRWYAGGIAAAVLAAAVLVAAIPAVMRVRGAPPPSVSAGDVERESAAGTVVVPAPAPSATMVAGGVGSVPAMGGASGVDSSTVGTLPEASIGSEVPGRVRPDAPPTAAGAVAATVGDTGRRVVVALTPPAPPAPAPAVVTRRAGPAEASPVARPAAPVIGPPAPVAPPAPPIGGPAMPAVGGDRVALYSERATIAAGARHTCALDGSGRALCWGANESGQLGAGDLTPRDTPSPVAGELRFTQVTTGGAHSCALTADGDAYCWGDDDHGQLGDATSSLRDAPVRVAGAGRYRALRAGLDHTCALTTGATVSCWGANKYGQLGDATTRDRATPAPVPGIRVVALSVGWRHTCALTADGTALCWGDNTDGQLGDGTRSPRSTPVPVAAGRPFVAIATGATHTCATTTDGGTYCWGTSGSDGSAHLTPTRVDGAVSFVTLVAGSVHSCGRTATGLVYCWGRNPYGQLGDGTTADHWRPARVPGGPYTAVSAAGAHTCAVADGAPVCWGYNVSGQLGDGTRAHHTTPVRVARAGP